MHCIISRFGTVSNNTVPQTNEIATTKMDTAVETQNTSGWHSWEPFRFKRS